MIGIETIEFHTFHPRFIGRDSLVLDLGANFGRFSHQIADRYGCRCLALEPSPEVFPHLRDSERVRKYQIAVCGTSGAVPFHVSEQDLASTILPLPGAVRTVEVPAVKLEDFIREHGRDRIALVKMDIEGAEVEVMDSCSDALLASIEQLSIEFHDFCGLVSGANVRRIVDRLEKLGFFYVRMSRVGNQDTWFINRRLCKISTAECLFIKWLSRNWRGFCRVTGRLLAPARAS